MHRFNKSTDRWWQKPLVLIKGRSLPAELAVLNIELRTYEDGVWLNSRGTKTGVVDLLCSDERGEKTFRTKRVSLPPFIVEYLERIYKDTKLKKGYPDLVIWNWETEQIRFVEVKCPRLDKPSPEQEEFMKFCATVGASVQIAEWEFES